MSEEQGGEARNARERVGLVFNKLERVYLAAIRIIALGVASLLVLYAGWLAISGTYKSARDVTSVKEAPASVSPEEVAQIDLNKVAKSSDSESRDQLAPEKRYYADFNKRYFSLFRTKFEPFKQAGDRTFDEKAFDTEFVGSAERIEGIRSGTINFERDRGDLESLLTTMSAAAATKPTLDRLGAYKSARKIKVSKTIRGTREQRYCSYYGYYIDECISYGTRTVPFSRTVEETKLPDGVISHIDLFGAYQDRYVSVLDQKRRTNAAAADRERISILADNADGSARLWSATKVAGGFLMLMFLFLLIALERHQRKIAASIEAEQS